MSKKKDLLKNRLALALYLVSSALAAFDLRSLSLLEIFIRIVVAILILSKPLELYSISIIAGILILVIHLMRSRYNLKIS